MSNFNNASVGSGTKVNEVVFEYNNFGQLTSDAGDAYIGLDRFGRAVDVRWVKGTTDVERVKYGFDRASNRMWRENPVAGTGQDEYYTFDKEHDEEPDNQQLDHSV